MTSAYIYVEQTTARRFVLAGLVGAPLSDSFVYTRELDGDLRWPKGRGLSNVFFVLVRAADQFHPSQTRIPQIYSQTRNICGILTMVFAIFQSGLVNMSFASCCRH